MTRVLIAGCGYIGAPTGKRLVERGCTVFGLRRSQAKLPAGVELVRGDLSRLDSLGSLPEGIDTVIYAAGAGASDEAAYRAVYMDGPSNLLRAMREQGEEPGRFLFCSSTAVYGQRRGEWVDEDSVTRPTRWNGELLLAAESLVRACGVPAVVLRLGGIYGPGRTRLVDRVRSGAARIQAEPHFGNRIHREDAAGALAHLALAPQGHDLYLGVDGQPSDEADVLRWLAGELGVASKPAVGAEDAPGPRAGSKRCRNDRLCASGYKFRYPSFREGYAELIAG